MVRADRELEAMHEIARAMGRTEPEAHRRMLAWAWDRWVDYPGRCVEALQTFLRALQGGRVVAPKRNRKRMMGLSERWKQTVRALSEDVQPGASRK